MIRNDARTDLCLSIAVGGAPKCQCLNSAGCRPQEQVRAIPWAGWSCCVCRACRRWTTAWSSTTFRPRLPAGSYVEAAYVGLQDTAPRDALLGLHARVEACEPAAWQHSHLVQTYSLGRRCMCCSPTISGCLQSAGCAGLGGAAGSRGSGRGAVRCWLCAI